MRLKPQWLASGGNAKVTNRLTGWPLESIGNDVAWLAKLETRRSQYMK